MKDPADAADDILVSVEGDIFGDACFVVERQLSVGDVEAPDLHEAIHTDGIDGACLAGLPARELVMAIKDDEVVFRKGCGHEIDLASSRTNDNIARPLLTATHCKARGVFDGAGGDATGCEGGSPADDGLRAGDGVFDDRNVCCFVVGRNRENANQIFPFDIGGGCQFSCC